MLLVATDYSDERKRLNFEHYMKIQKDQNHILERRKEHGHVWIDPSYQVRNLNEDIKITQFDVVKAQILAAASLRIDYDGCASLYKIFIDQIKKLSPLKLNISGVDSSNHKGGG